MSYPHLVVSVLCESKGKILMVNELDNGINCWNQPAGHVEPGESLFDAARREALEETGYEVKLTGIQGIYEGLHSESRTHYVRVSFYAVADSLTDRKLDEDIIEARWLLLADLRQNKYQLRSDITRQTLEDLGKAPIIPLDFIHSVSFGDF